jgi:hypothetical protein
VAPPTDPYQPNDNTVLSPFSLFWGGAITSNVGAFVQVTYSSPDPLSSLTGTPADQFKHTWSWDNADVRGRSLLSRLRRPRRCFRFSKSRYLIQGRLAQQSSAEAAFGSIAKGTLDADGEA